MYSGQGSQYYQMGQDLFSKNTIFRASISKADQMHQDMTGFSVLDELYNEQNNKSKIFSETKFTHPAIYMFEYALTQVLLENNIHPDIVLGSSLGELAAATISSAFDFETGLKAVIAQANALEQCKAGSMLAILSDPSLYQRESYLNKYSELAAVNFSNHFVVSGTLENLQNIVTELNQSNIVSQILPVSQAFHSENIENAKQPFLNAIEPLMLNKAKIPIVSCKNANYITELSKEHFWDVVRYPILFQKTIQLLESQGTFNYLDLGPSGTLATFVKYNLSPNSQSKPITLLSPYGQDVKNLDAVLKLFEKI